MSWFKRDKEGISTQTKDKKEVPEGMWYKCPRCKKTVTSKEHKEHLDPNLFMMLVYAQDILKECKELSSGQL